MENRTPVTPLEDSLRGLFRIIWSTREKKSFLTGFWLRDFSNTPLFWNLFAHVLAKGQNKFPYFRHYLKNVVLLTPGEHALLDQGTAEQRKKYSEEVEAATGGTNKADWAKIEALEEELKEEYKKYFPSTKGFLIGIKYSPAEVKEIVTMLNQKYIDSIKEKAVVNNRP